MSNISNQQWEGDLEADQLDDLAAREGREDGSFGAQIPLGSAPRQASGASPDAAADTGANTAAGESVSNRQWANDLEADQLDDISMVERADELDEGL
jgi:hypothetical protein